MLCPTTLLLPQRNDSNNHQLLNTYRGLGTVLNLPHDFSHLAYTKSEEAGADIKVMLWVRNPRHKVGGLLAQGHAVGIFAEPLTRRCSDPRDKPGPF